MSLTDEQIQALITTQVGDEVTTEWPDGVLSANIATIWEGYTDESAALQRLYTKRDCIDLVLGIVRKKVDFRDPAGISADLSDLYDHLVRMRADCLQDIDRVVSGSAQGSTTLTFVPANYGDSGTTDEFARPECWP
jgi:hypothetical protein